MGNLESQLDGITEITDEQITAVRSLLAEKVDKPDADLIAQALGLPVLTEDESPENQ